MTTDPVLLSIERGVAWLTLGNPSKRNAIDAAFVECFSQCVGRCVGDKTVKVVAIAAQGEFFSVGGDLSEFVEHEQDIKSHIFKLATKFHEGIETLNDSALPVVVAVKGVAAGGGFSLVCGADFVIAGKSAKFVSAYTKTGLTPDGGGTYFLERIVGYRKAFEILALNPVLSAEQAYELGIVTEVADDADLDAAVERMVVKILSVPSDAIAALKRLTHPLSRVEIRDQLMREAEAISQQAEKPTTLNALKSFLRRPI